MIDWLKQQYTDLLVKIFPLMPSYIAKECYEEFDEKYKEFRIMTENKRYSFNWERGHPQFWDNHCDLADCYLTCEDVVKLLNELHEENQRLTDKLNQTALELVDVVISQGKAVEISEMSYSEFLDYRAKNGKPMELQL